jgi:hypothetical protein
MEEPREITGTTGMQQTAVPPSEGNQTKSPTGQKIVGKMENVLGSMVGSDSLKAKGLRREQYVRFLLFRTNLANIRHCFGR